MFCGAASTVLALSVNSVYTLFYLCSDLVYAILFPQLLCVIYYKYANTYGSITGYFVGLFLRIAAGEKEIDFEGLIKYPYYDEEYGQLFPYRTFTMLCSLMTIVIVSYITRCLFLKEVVPMKYDFLSCFRQADKTESRGKPTSTNDIALQNQAFKEWELSV